MTKPASAPPADLVQRLIGKLFEVAARHNDRSCDYDVCSVVRDAYEYLNAAQAREVEAWTPAQAGDRALGRNRGKPAPERRCPYCAGHIYTDAGCQNCKVGTTYPKPAPESAPVAQESSLISRLRIMATDYAPGSILRNTIEQAIETIARRVEPHCSEHVQFDIDCLDCSDALEQQRKIK
jgi:hypothetical protein